MANITVTVPDEVYHAARIRAAEARTSVSALVRGYLTRLAEEGSEFQRLVALQNETITRVHERGAGFAAADRMSRDDAHDRDALR